MAKAGLATLVAMAAATTTCGVSSTILKYIRLKTSLSQGCVFVVLEYLLIL